MDKKKWHLIFKQREDSYVINDHTYEDVKDRLECTLDYKKHHLPMYTITYLMYSTRTYSLYSE